MSLYSWSQYLRYVVLAAEAAAVDDEAVGLAAGDAPAADAPPLPPALSKYLSKAALALPGGPNGVFFSFSPARSLLADLARWISLLAVDILEAVDTLEEEDILLATDAELISEPEPNSRSSLVRSVDMLRPIFFSLPSRPLLFFFSPGSHSLWVDSREPVESRSTLVSRSRRRMVIAL